MKRFLLAALLCSAGGDALAWRQPPQVRGVVTKFRDFFRPLKHDIKKSVAAVTVPVLLCATMLQGCAIRYPASNKQLVRGVQEGIAIAAGAATIGMLITAGVGTNNQWKDEIDVSKTLRYTLIPVSVLIVDGLWAASTEFYDSYGNLAVLPGKEGANRDVELPSYLREHLTPETYNSLLTASAGKSGWVAIPTTREELFADVDDTHWRDLVTSIEEAPAFYYGKRVELGMKDRVFELDTVKYNGTEATQPLAKDEIFSVLEITTEE